MIPEKPDTLSAAESEHLLIHEQFSMDDPGTKEWVDREVNAYFKKHNISKNNTGGRETL